jgi:threonine synthase
MSRCLAYFNKDKKKVKHSSCGYFWRYWGAVASGFLGVAGVEVIILYPSGR